MKLYQKARTGKTKFLEIKADGSLLITRWGILGGKMQETTKVCTPMNIGKANALTGAEQAKAEMQAKITLKKKEGYADTPPDEKPAANNKNKWSAHILLDQIPESFCPCKPISKCPPSVFKSLSTIAQRKHNGHCVFLVKAGGLEMVYSRRMENLTESCATLPFINQQLELCDAGDFVLSEVVYHHNKLNKEVPRFVAQVIRNEDPIEAIKRYKELSKEGTFKCIPFDILFHNNKFVGGKTYMERYTILKKLRLKNLVEMITWEGPEAMLVTTAKQTGWEGFVLRDPNKSQISYSLDGKAHRQGSYKYKFVETGDFVVNEVLKGKSGKHSQFYSKFHLVEYGVKGEIIDRGYVGPGTLSHDQLKALTEELKSNRRKVPFVVEIEYQSIHDETGKLEFGIIQRIREDKTPQECISED